MKKHTTKRILSALIAALFVAGSVGFSAVADHTHEYAAETVVEPGYIFGGYIVYRCACGDSYTEQLPPRMQPYCTMTEGRVYPGGSVTIEATLLNCGGLADLTLDVGYDENCLYLADASCAEYGAPTRITDKALQFDSIDPEAQEAVLTLTFTAYEDAPNGIYSVSVSGSGNSACAADGGMWIILSAARSSVQVYRPPRLTVTAPDGPVFAGETAQMTVDIVNNPGIAGMALELHYDPQVLTLTGVQQEGMFAQGNIMMSGSLSTTPFRVIWDDADTTDIHTEDGPILTLTFKVKASAPAGTTNVWVEFGEDDVLDMKLRPVELAASGAELSILRRMPGDTDGDNDVDVADIVCLSRFIAGGWDIEVDERNSDVNADGSIDLKDVVLIRRYLAGGWGVVLA